VVAFSPFLGFRGLWLLGRRGLFWRLGWGVRVRLRRVDLGRLSWRCGRGRVHVAGLGGGLALFLGFVVEGSAWSALRVYYYGGYVHS